MLALVLCAVVGQAQSPVRVGIVRGPNLGVAAERADALISAMRDRVAAEGLDAVLYEGTCSGHACVSEAGRALHAEAVITVSLAAVGEETVMDLECVVLKDGNAVAQSTFNAAGPGESAASFIRQVKRAVSRPAPVVVAPVVPAAPPVVEERPRLRPLAIGTGALFIALAAGGGVLTAVNSADADGLRRSMHGGLLPASRVGEAAALEDRTWAAAGLLISAGVTAVLAIAFAVVSR